MRFPALHKNPGFLALALVVLTGASQPVPAAAAVAACPLDTLDVVPVKAEDRGKDPASLPLDLEADQVEKTPDGPIVLQGNARITQGSRSVAADEIRYDQDSDEMQARGNVVLRSASGSRFESDTLEYKIGSGVGEAGQTRFELAVPAKPRGGPKRFRRRYQEDETRFETQVPEMARTEQESAGGGDTPAGPASGGQVRTSGRGEADRVNFEGAGLLRLNNATFTRCARGQNDVLISAGQIRLDQIDGVGVAKNVKVKFLGVPIYYSPRMSFPISDQRKSGFLSPSFGSDQRSGSFWAIPYYWNIAPSMDATVTPRYYADRGLMLQGEFRYLGENYRGRLGGNFLPSDDVFGDDRSSFSWRHDQRFSSRLTGRVNFQDVSDTSYYNDFSKNLRVSSATHLPQRASLAYSGDRLYVSADALVYQTIDPTIAKSSQPSERLPRVRFGTRFPYKSGQLNYGIKGEVVNFQHDTRVAGTRLDLTPSVSLPLKKVYGFVKPQVSLRHTSYSGLDNVAPGADTGPSRTVGVFSIDSGLFFERETRWQGRAFTQTLEPRLFYVYAEKQEQDNLPNFDTGVLSLNNFSNLFRDNRFVGADRVEDANRVTVALTSRLVEDSTGREWARGSIGQIYYFADREVGTDDTTDKSDFLAQGKITLNKDLRVGATWRWDPEQEVTREGRIDVDYRPGGDRRAFLAYRFLRDSREQLDLQFNWPLAPRWRVFGRSLYDIRNSNNLSTSVSVRYNACCWAVSLGAWQRVDNQGQERNAIFVQLELTGIAAVRTGF